MRQFLIPLMLLIPVSVNAQSGGQHPQHGSMPTDHPHHMMMQQGGHASQHQMTQEPNAAGTGCLCCHSGDCADTGSGPAHGLVQGGY